MDLAEVINQVYILASHPTSPSRYLLIAFFPAQYSGNHNNILNRGQRISEKWNEG